MESDRNHIDRILERLEVLRDGVRELDRLHSSVRAEIIRSEIKRLGEDGAEALAAE
ncbi:MAG: hypothetical protein ABR592_02715 [Nitriliruptorales bacterium]